MFNLVRSIVGDFRVPIVYLRDVERVVVGGVQIGPAKRGDQGRIPFGILRQVLEMGIASVQREYMVDEKDVVQRIFLEQRDERTLNELPKDFYVRVKATIIAREVAEGGRGGSTLAQRLKELASIRLRKIVAIISTSPDVVHAEDFAKKLALEEEALAFILSNEIKDWMAGMLMF